jgi:hypothetical protein
MIVPEGSNFSVCEGFSQVPTVSLSPLIVTALSFLQMTLCANHPDQESSEMAGSRKVRRFVDSDTDTT